MDGDTKPTCVIADDHEIVVRGLANVLSSFVDVVASASSGFEAIQLVLQHEPDLLFLDVRMPGPGVDGVLGALSGDRCDTRVVVFSSVTAIDRVKSAFDNGALGYVSKDAPLSTLRSAVEAVIAGRRFLDPLLAPEVVGQAGPTLSGREYQTLELMARGAQNAAIAHELGIAQETVKSHISSILRKLDCTSRTSAVAHALRTGVVD